MSAAVAAMPAAPMKATWICLAIAWLCFLAPIPGAGLVVGWPLNAVAFILAIVCMSKAGAKAGLLPLLVSIIASPLIYLVGIAIMGFGFMHAAESSATADTKLTNKWIDVPYVVTPQEFTQSYREDRVAADQKYKGQKIEVTGKIVKLEPNHRKGLQITFDRARGQALAIKGLPSTAAATLTRGQWITLSCQGAGQITGTPVLENCATQ